ncbi:serine/threonine-protein kinase ATG1t [Andrographis paniculata]|uniref:serine/threonine-protein kinase ATG1t n=1 Tax=Andrographis paniculata TaxID=175694 RepID=UPI0021E91B88|nr:serine/threonine-protein kinase ATG1t [Andrographis paniculata]
MMEERRIWENRRKNANQSSIEDYILRSKLRESSLSTVWKAERRATGEVVAVKQIHVLKLTRHLRNCLDCELNFLSSVDHPNIIRLFDFFRYEDCIFLVMEFCAGGNLASYIRRHGRLQEIIAKRFMQQLGAGLKVMKQNHMVHRDLKPENIFLSCSDCNPILKIADFGLSRIIYPNETAETVCGSPLYMAPEILQFQRYNDKVDMWSTGAMLFELLNGYPPFHGRNHFQILQNIKASTSLPFSNAVLPELHGECVDLCTRLLSINPDHRLSFDEFYQHSFLREV